MIPLDAYNDAQMMLKYVLNDKSIVRLGEAGINKDSKYCKDFKRLTNA